VAAVDSNRLASGVVKAGVAIMGYDVIVGLAQLLFGDRVSPAWTVPAFLGIFVLFPVTFFGVTKQYRERVGIGWNLTLIFWMLRNIPHWAKVCWAATIIAVLGLLFSSMRSNDLSAGRTALTFTAFSFYFALSCTFIGWAKLREQQRDPFNQPPAARSIGNQSP